MSKPPYRRARRRGSGSWSAHSWVARGHGCRISSIIWAPSSRWSSSALPRPLCRRRGRRGGRRRRPRPGPCRAADSPAGRVCAIAPRAAAIDCGSAAGPGGLRRLGRGCGSRGGAASSAAQLGGSAGLPAARGRREGCGRPAAACGVCLGAGVDDRVDPPVGADHVDRGLAHDLVAAAADEGVAGAGVREAEGQRVAVDADDLGVLGEVHPGDPAAAAWWPRRCRARGGVRRPG